MEQGDRIERKLDKLTDLLNTHIKDCEHRISILETWNYIKIVVIAAFAGAASYFKFIGG